MLCYSTISINLVQDKATYKVAESDHPPLPLAMC